MDSNKCSGHVWTYTRDANDRKLPCAGDQLDKTLEGQDFLFTDLYYAKFHDRHPLLVPKSVYHAISLPVSLRATVRFIGSLFAKDVEPERYRDEAATALMRDVSWTPFRIQALLLQAIVFYAHVDYANAQSALTSATHLANIIGMNAFNFARSHSNENADLEESFRRTWWELFTIDGLLAATQHLSEFPSNNASLEAGLPCDKPSSMPAPPTLAQFDQRFFHPGEITYSPYCYRIEAVRVLACVLAIAEDTLVDMDEFLAVDRALTSWEDWLPSNMSLSSPAMRENADELVYQAHLIARIAAILLHFPRAGLRQSGCENETESPRQWPPLLPPKLRQEIHLSKALSAARVISAMASRRSADLHTPFVAYALFLSLTVQLGVDSMDACYSSRHKKEMCLLTMGVLKAVAQTWPVARQHLEEVRGIAQQAPWNLSVASPALET